MADVTPVGVAFTLGLAAAQRAEAAGKPGDPAREAAILAFLKDVAAGTAPDLTPLGGNLDEVERQWRDSPVPLPDEVGATITAARAEFRQEHERMDRLHRTVAAELIPLIDR